MPATSQFLFAYSFHIYHCTDFHSVSLSFLVLSPEDWICQIVTAAPLPSPSAFYLIPDIITHQLLHAWELFLSGWIVIHKLLLEHFVYSSIGLWGNSLQGPTARLWGLTRLWELQSNNCKKLNSANNLNRQEMGSLLRPPVNRVLDFHFWPTGR